MHHRLPLFDHEMVMTVASPVTRPRAAQIESAFGHADAAFLARYEGFLRTAMTDFTDFTACEVTGRYIAKHGKLSPRQKKSLGGLYQRLMRSGVIEKTGGYRLRDQGNASAIYRLKTK